MTGFGPILDGMKLWVTLLGWSWVLVASAQGVTPEIWQGHWVLPGQGLHLSSEGQVQTLSDGQRQVAVVGHDGHEGGYDCVIRLKDDSTGWAEHCPLFGQTAGPAMEVGVRRIAGESVLVRFDHAGEWSAWAPSVPAWWGGMSAPLAAMWRAMAGTWSAESGPSVGVDVHRPALDMGDGWMAFGEAIGDEDQPMRGGIELEDGRVYQVALTGDRMRLTPMTWSDMQGWQVSGEVKVFEAANRMPLAAFDAHPGQYPELSLAPVFLSQLRRPTDELRRMRNEMFARRGWRFSSADLKAHFEAQPWYTPGEDNAGIVLSEVERFNAAMLRRFEQAEVRRQAQRPDLAAHFGMEWNQFEEVGLDPGVSPDGSGLHWMIAELQGQFGVVQSKLVPRPMEETALFRGVSLEGMPEAKVVATFDPGTWNLNRVRHVSFPPELEPGVEVELGEDRFVSEIVAVQDEYRQLQFRRIESDGHMTDVQSEGMWLEFPQRIEWAGDLNGDGRTDVILGSSRKSSVTLFQFWVSNPMTGTLELRAEKELSGS